MDKEVKDVYISETTAGMIEHVLDLEKDISRVIFDGNLKDTIKLIKFFRENPEAKWLLDDIWDYNDPLYNVVSEEFDYKRAIPALKDYLDKTGIRLRWAADNRKNGLPIPEDDQHSYRFAEHEDGYYNEYYNYCDEPEIYKDVPFD